MHFTNSLALAAILLTLASTAPEVTGATVDPCATLASLSSPKPSHVRACYSSFAFSATRRDETLSSLKKMFLHYAMDDVARQPPNPSVNTPFDIQSTIASFDGKTYNSDLEFQTALQLATLKSNDGHTKYIPRCYGTYTFRLPFYLAQVNPTLSEPKIYIAGVAASASDKYGQWNGAEVVSIEGQDPTAFLQAYADKYVGGSKEPLTRLSQTLVSPIWNSDTAKFDIRTGFFTSRVILPDTDTLTFALRKSSSLLGSTKVEVPYTVKAPPTKFSSASSYWSTFCAPYSFSDVVQGRPDPSSISNSPQTMDSMESVEQATRVSALLWSGSGKYGFILNKGLWNGPVDSGDYSSQDTVASGNSSIQDTVASGNSSIQDTVASGNSSSQDTVASGNHSAQDTVDDDLSISVPTEVSATVASPSNSSEPVSKVRATARFLSIPAPTMPVKASVPPPVLVANGPGFAFFTQTLQDDRTIVAVLTISEMGLWDAPWMTSFARGMKGVKASGAKRLIIDVSNNLGGNICTARSFASALKQPSSKSFPDLDKPWVTRFRDTPLAKVFANVSLAEGAPSPYNPTHYLDSQLKPRGPNMDAFIPGVTRSPPGPYPYTDDLVDSCDGSVVPEPLIAPFNKGETTWDPSQMIILSNGLCGSSCAQFVQYLSRVLKVKIVSSGGSGSLSNRGVVSYAGGQAFAYSDLAEMIWGLGLESHPLAYSPLPARANVGLTIRTTDSYANPAQAMEYDGLRADYRMDYTVNQVLGVGDRWAQAYAAVWGTPTSIGSGWPWFPCHFTDGRGRY
ncbi:MAG: hypothetical protein DHS80DRAFT_24040 [Piptocephalis tieghemiana]|nr:MAG: hypothetical protein DHS80DRAFT_24040 [Piptocephalis tieghemiana]